MRRADGASETQNHETGQLRHVDCDMIDGVAVAIGPGKVHGLDRYRRVGPPHERQAGLGKTLSLIDTLAGRLSLIGRRRSQGCGRAATQARARLGPSQAQGEFKLAKNNSVPLWIAGMAH